MDAAVDLPSREPELALELRSQPRLLAAARGLVVNLARRLGFDDVESGQVSLAVDEALCNVINHGYKRRADGPIRLRIWTDDAAADGTGSVVFLLEDRAETVDPATIKSRSLDEIRPGGLGVHIIREVMDEVHYAPREGGGMQLYMRKTLPDGESVEACGDTQDEQTGDGHG